MMSKICKLITMISQFIPDIRDIYDPNNTTTCISKLYIAGYLISFKQDATRFAEQRTL